MHAFQDPSALAQFGRAFDGFPFLSQATVSAVYLAWVLVWLALVLGLAGVTFARRDL